MYKQHKHHRLNHSLADSQKKKSLISLIGNNMLT